MGSMMDPVAPISTLGPSTRRIFDFDRAALRAAAHSLRSLLYYHTLLQQSLIFAYPGNV